MSSSARRALPAVVCLGALAATTVPAPAFAGGFTLTSFGGRRCGMLANLGRPDEPTALVHNPAGLADQPGVQLYLFLSPAFLSLDVEMKALDHSRFTGINPSGCETSSEHPCSWPVGVDGYYARKIKPERYFGVLPYIGATTDLGFVSPGLRDVVVSLAVHAPNFYGAYFPEDAPSAYNFIGGMFLVVGTTVGAGWRINEHLAIGASISYNLMYISMSQKLSVVDTLTERGAEPGAAAKLAQALIGDVRLDYEGLDHGVGWGASLLITPVPWLGIGLGYNGASPARFEGDVHFSPLGTLVHDEQKVRELAGGLGYALPRRLALEMSIPHALSVGLNAALGRRVEIGVDLRLWFYNLYEQQLIEPIYDAGDLGEPAISKDALSRDKDYRLSYQITAGVLVRPIRYAPQLELMLGAGYDQSPIPDETLTLDNPSLSQVKLTAGVRWQVDRHWRLSAGYLLVIYMPRDIDNSRTNPPTNVRGDGVSHSPNIAMTYRF